MAKNRVSVRESWRQCDTTSVSCCRNGRRCSISDVCVLADDGFVFGRGGSAITRSNAITSVEMLHDVNEKIGENKTKIIIIINRGNSRGHRFGRIACRAVDRFDTRKTKLYPSNFKTLSNRLTM